MRKPYWSLAALTLILCVKTAAGSQGPPPTMTWVPVGDRHAYSVNASGKLWSAEGAAVTVSRQPGSSSPAGGLMAGFDAAPFVGKDITLTANLATTGGASNAAIWLRTDGPTPEAHTFQTTQQRFAVRDGEPAVLRSVRLAIPKDAKDVVLGVLLFGDGQANASHLRLTVADAATVNVDAPALLDEAVATIRAHALAAGAVDWDAFLKVEHTGLASGEPAAKAYPVIRDAIKKLDDGHSFFMDAAWATSTANNDGTRETPVVKVLPGGVGYVMLPGFTGPDDARRHYVETIATAIEHDAPSVTHGWIVDLRKDTGGAVPPMLGAIQSLLGSEPVGAYRTPGKPDHKVYAGRELSFERKPAVDLAAAPVAVILGPHTSSAGEMVAIAFHGRPLTRSFGTTTSGQASGNALFRLADGSQLALKGAIDVDRHGQVFGKAVEPDERVGDEAVLDRATEWLTHR
ncbi:S41 family peptidase [Luteibacter sp.]|uniref:S41 family peptidase n=1 Tax=Luteibacter sp. TaxID=1886636 RepID=UPI003F7FF685